MALFKPDFDLPNDNIKRRNLVAMRAIDRIDELEQALEHLLEAFDALMPGARHIAVDIGLLNDAACQARPLVDAIQAARK